MRVKVSIVILLSIIISVAGCKKKDGEHHDHETMMSSPNTKMVNHEGVHIVVDLMKKDQHIRMMKMMDSNIQHYANSDYFIVLTLKEIESKKIIKGVKPTVTIVDPVKKEVQKDTQVMQGKGMYHYCMDFKKTKTGKYDVKVNFTFNEKKHEILVSFDLE